MGVALHLACPLEKTPQTFTLPPHKFPKFQKADLRHLDSAIGFDAPQQVWTSPRSQPMAFGGIPQEAERMAHGNIITIERMFRTHLSIFLPCASDGDIHHY